MFSRKTSSIAVRDLPPLIAATALCLIPIVCAVGLLAALPLLALVIPLLFGFFPGESVIERLAARRSSSYSRRQRRGSLGAPRPLAVRTLLRNGLLIAASFAKRPPPALPLTS